MRSPCPAVVLLLAALVVPDEPFHLSGVTLVAGLVLAALALLAGIVGAFASKDAETRQDDRFAAILSLLLILVVLGVLHAPDDAVLLGAGLHRAPRIAHEDRRRRAPQLQIKSKA